MIKLIATDLDNTLLDSQGELPKSTLVLLRRAVKQGVVVAVATGRSFNSANRIADMISPKSPVICYNGAVIKDAEDNVLYEKYLDWDISKKIIRFAKRNDIYVQLYEDDTILVEELRLECHPDPDLQFTDYREVEDLLSVGPIKTPKILLATDPALVPKYQSRLEKLYGEVCFFAQSDAHLIEVMPKGVDKGAALRRLSRIFKIKKAETMALGDNTNDILLLKASGLPVAVANAVPQLKEVSKYVCKGERSKGVSEALRKFVVTE